MGQLARRLCWAGLAAGLGALAVGLVLAVGSAVSAGDWDLARQPWIGLGLTLIVVGLAATAVSGVAMVYLEPVGRLRWLAVVPGMVVASLWAGWLIFGVGTTGRGGPEHDVATILYSLPQMLVVMVAATLAILLPLILARFRRGT